MAHVIAAPCVADYSCVEVCPVNCIGPSPNDTRLDGVEQLYIDPSRCIDCSACVDACPVSAIYKDTDIPEKWQHYRDLNREYFLFNPAALERALGDGVSSVSRDSVDRPLRVAIVGSGPAGMYAVGSLLEESGLNVEIDLYDRLPTPGGLVRAGVAPDHLQKKLITDRLFSHYLRWPQVRFIGNVEVGRHIYHADLSDWYDSVVYAVGATNDKRIGIPGEELVGSWSAHEFVSWYNGHPDFAHLKFDFSCERAIVVGNGNVSLDVARMLTMPLSCLEKTDIADYALEALQDRNIREVVILGRRGLAEASFSNAELEELGSIEGVEIVVDHGCQDESLVPMDSQLSWVTRRKFETLAYLSSRREEKAKKRIVFQFRASPLEIQGSTKVEQILLARNALKSDAEGKTNIFDTKERIRLDAGLVLLAIGYGGVPLQGLPFNYNDATIDNILGRVVSSGVVACGAYVVGWIKRGPRGVIGSNKQCARETVQNLCKDFIEGLLEPASLSREQVLAAVRQRQPKLILEQGWRRIDRFERHIGRRQGRPRVKVTDVDSMIEISKKGEPGSC